MSDEQFKALFNFFKPVRHVYVLADRARESSHLPDCCACCHRTHLLWLYDQLEYCQRLKLKAIQLEQELLDNDNKPKELGDAKVLYCSPETLAFSMTTDIGNFSFLGILCQIKQWPTISNCSRLQ